RTGPFKPRLRARAFAADDWDPEAVAGPSVWGERCLEVLARLARRDRQDVRAFEVGALAFGAKSVRIPRLGDADPLALDAQQLVHVGRRVFRVAEKEIRRANRVAVLRTVHSHRSAVRPFRIAQRHEVMN